MKRRKAFLNSVLTAIAALVVSSSAMGAPALVQSTRSVFVAATSTISLTLNGVQAGNFLVTVFHQNNCTATQQLSTVSDGTNNFTLLPQNFSYSASMCLQLYMAYLPNVTAGNKTVTVNFSSSTGGSSMWFAEFSGVATTSPLDVSDIYNGATSSTTVDFPQITTTQDGDLVLAGAISETSFSNVIPPWVGNAEIQNGNGFEYQVQSAAGLISAGWAQSPTGKWTGIMAAFKATPIARVRHKAIQD